MGAGLFFTGERVRPFLLAGFRGHGSRHRVITASSTRSEVRGGVFTREHVHGSWLGVDAS